MPLDIERIASLEAKVNNMEESMNRIRDHISDLLTFKSTMEGGMKAVQVLLGIVGLIGLGNFGLMLRIFISK